MNIRQIRENLGRVKASFLRNENLRALSCFVAAMKELGNNAPATDLKGDIREAVQYLMRDTQIKALLPAGLSGYAPGQEKSLLLLFTKILERLTEAEGTETSEAALERKIKIDQAYNAGVKHLGQGRVSEADASFAEAASLCKDEYRLFHMIASALLDAGEVVRAGPYLKRGMEALPGNPDLTALLERARVLRQAMKAK